MLAALFTFLHLLPGNQNDDGHQSDEAVGRSSESDNNSDAETEPSDMSSGSDEENEDEEYLRDDNLPLYDGSPITLRESAVAVLSFVLAHSLSGVCVNDLLSLIALHCGPNNRCLKSLYLFRSYFDMQGQKDSKRHHYCSGCEVPLENKDSVCALCRGRHEVSYFLEFSIANQLKGMFKRPEFYEALRFKSNRVKKFENGIEDMFDGKVYKDCQFLLNPNNISFNMFFDGVAVYKNSKFQLWPVYLSINELKYKDRTKKENIVIAGLWFGKSKPNSCLFLDPICQSLQALENEGLNITLPGQVINVKCRALAAVGDLPAKAAFVRLIQYNGGYSCFNCLSSGARYGQNAVIKNTIQVFPYERRFQLRTSADMIDFAQQALAAREVDQEATVYGVKGPSQLSVCLPDLIDCLGIDVMHGVFLNLTRTLLELWFDTQHSHQPFSIANCVDIVDLRLKQIKPPFSFQRLPRSLKTEIALMKASDLKLFFFFYSVPLLADILPKPFWDHHCKIVSAIALLSQDSVSDEDIDSAEELIHSYVAEFQQLYGIRYLGLNLHQLLHLASVVRNLGPTWVYSCFFYESLNGLLLKLVHGTRHAALQISSAASACVNLNLNINNMVDGDAKRLCMKFLSTANQRLKVAEVIDDVSCVLGVYQENRLPQFVRNLLQDTFEIPNGGRVKTFLRMKKKGIIYSSESYTRSTKKQSCYVEVSQDGNPLLGKINYFVRWSSCEVDCPRLCAVCPKMFFVVVSVYDRVPWQIHDLGLIFPYLNKVKPTARSIAFTVNSLNCACLYINIDGDEYMCTPINSLEVE